MIFGELWNFWFLTANSVLSQDHAIKGKKVAVKKVKKKKLTVILMSLAACQINPIDVNFHLKKSLEIFDKNSVDKIWSRKDLGGGKCPPSCQLGLTLIDSDSEFLNWIMGSALHPTKVWLEAKWVYHVFF